MWAQFVAGSSRLLQHHREDRKGSLFGNLFSVSASVLLWVSEKVGREREREQAARRQSECASGKGQGNLLLSFSQRFFHLPCWSGGQSKAKMEAERTGGVAGGTNQSSAVSGSRNPNGPKTVLGPAGTTAAAAGGMMAGAMHSSRGEPQLQDGEAGLSLPGILHFIQFEWGRFQSEKCRWEAERDELRVSFCFAIPVVRLASRLFFRRNSQRDLQRNGVGTLACLFV